MNAGWWIFIGFVVMQTGLAIAQIVNRLVYHREIARIWRDGYYDLEARYLSALDAWGETEIQLEELAAPSPEPNKENPS